VVLTSEELRSILGQLQGLNGIMAMVLSGAGLRLMECLRRRAKDIDCSRSEIVVRDGKGGKDRVTMRPTAVKEPLRRHLDWVRTQDQDALRSGSRGVTVPYALERKYPNGAREWGWQWVFPASGYYTDRTNGQKRRHHLHESVFHKAVKEAVCGAGVCKAASCHTFRHSFATHLLEDGYDIRTPPSAEVLEEMTRVSRERILS